MASAKAAEIWHRNMGIPMAVSSHTAHRTTRSDDLRMGPSSPEAPDFFVTNPIEKFKRVDIAGNSARGS